MTDIDDRAAGVLLATACGDALGAGYEFGPPLPAGTDVSMKGGNGFRPGEWTDDTALAIVVAEAAARHGLAAAGRLTAEGLDAVAAGFLRWLDADPVDVGVQTRAVLSAAGAPTAAALTAASRAYYDANPGHGAGTGALMRTAPVALSTWEQDDATVVAAATAVGALTHADPVSGEACALWTLAIRHAVRHASFDGLRRALGHLAPDRAAYWSDRLDEAERLRPSDFDRNGWVVQALQAAWSAIATTPVPPDAPGRHLVLALENAVRGGRDADTVAAIAGGLLGARWGASAIPPQWTDEIHGWPGYRADDLTRLARAIRHKGAT